MIGPVLFGIAFVLLLACALWQRHRRRYLFASEFEAALNVEEQFRMLSLQVGRALLPAVKQAAEAMVAFGQALQGPED